MCNFLNGCGFAADDAYSVDNCVDLNMSKEELVSNQDFGQSHGMDLFQTGTQNLHEDGIALDDEKKVESSDCAAESLDDEKGTDLEDLNPLRIHNAVLQRDESADTEIEPKPEEQDACMDHKTCYRAKGRR